MKYLTNFVLFLLFVTIGIPIAVFFATSALIVLNLILAVLFAFVLLKMAYNILQLKLW